MKPACNVATLIERFFTERLMRQRNVSANTIASYRDTFRLLFMFAQVRLRKSPSALTLADLDATFIGAFLTDLEVRRGASAKTRNLRLTAVRSFFRFVSFEEPAHSALIQRVLAIPSKRHDKRQVHFLTRPEIEAVLAAPDRTTWLGRRDHTLLLVAAQTGLRLSELTGLDRDAVHLGSGAHVRCVGKGRKERTTPLTTLARCALQAWLKEPLRKGATALFPNVHGGPPHGASVCLWSACWPGCCSPPPTASPAAPRSGAATHPASSTLCGKPSNRWIGSPPSATASPRRSTPTTAAHPRPASR